MIILEMGKLKPLFFVKLDVMLNFELIMVYMFDMQSAWEIEF